MHNHSPFNFGFWAGIASVVAGLSLSEWAALVGIFVALLSLVFGIRRDRREKRKEKREQLLLEYQIGIRKDRRELDCQVCDLHRRIDDCKSDSRLAAIIKFLKIKFGFKT